MWLTNMEAGEMISIVSVHRLRHLTEGDTADLAAPDRVTAEISKQTKLQKQLGETRLWTYFR